MRRIILPICIALIAISALSGCSTYYTDTVFKPRSMEALKVRRNGTRYDAVLTTPDFTLAIGAPALGSTRVTTGPCLFPFFPNAKERPYWLLLTLRFEPTTATSTLQIRPGDWVARTRAKEFGKTFGAADIFKEFHPNRAVFYPGRELATARPLYGWSRSRRGKPGADTVTLRGAAWGRFEFPPYNHDFKDFELKDIKLIINGKKVILPTIRFRRKTRGRYTPFTTKILDL